MHFFILYAPSFAVPAFSVQDSTVSCLSSSLQPWSANLPTATSNGKLLTSKLASGAMTTALHSNMTKAGISHSIRATQASMTSEASSQQLRPLVGASSQSHRFTNSDAHSKGNASNSCTCSSSDRSRRLSMRSKVAQSRSQMSDMNVGPGDAGSSVEPTSHRSSLLNPSLGHASNSISSSTGLSLTSTLPTFCPSPRRLAGLTCKLIQLASAPSASPAGDLPAFAKTFSVSIDSADEMSSSSTLLGLPRSSMHAQIDDKSLTVDNETSSDEAQHFFQPSIRSITTRYMSRQADTSNNESTATGLSDQDSSLSSSTSSNRFPFKSATLQASPASSKRGSTTQLKTASQARTKTLHPSSSAFLSSCLSPSFDFSSLPSPHPGTSLLIKRPSCLASPSYTRQQTAASSSKFSSELPEELELYASKQQCRLSNFGLEEKNWSLRRSSLNDRSVRA
ncbi:unnamed protein product [Protopolystoma xenopodis]|uniref:Uncharacterized protein n=1 Tax=Protopolystoma xenopodis TaxID=117903 RepID=A0A448WP15_9PLAT|nr:unnamed protein product [Protopolystoma xenopodis]